MAKKSVKELIQSPQNKKLAAIQAACAALQNKFGKESVNFLGNNKVEPIPRIPTGSIALDRITGGGYPIGRMIEVFGPASSGKCLTKDTMILTKEGYRSLEEVFLLNNITPCCTQKEIPCSFPLINMNGEEENTTHFVMNGKRKVYKITTQNGTVIKSTAKHPLRVITPNGYMIWKNTNELQTNDILVGRIGGNYFSKKENNENEKIEASILGLIIADGYLNDNKIGFLNSNEELINYYKENYNKVLEFENVDLKEDKSEARIETELYLNSKKQIDLFYNRTGLKNILTKDRFVPEFIFNGNETLQKTFLKFYFDCKATIEEDNINVISASYKLLYQIKTMLSNMGIMTSLKPEKSNYYLDDKYWSLYIFNNNIIKFNDKIGWFTKDKKDRIVKFYEDVEFNDDGIPCIGNMLEEYYNSIDPAFRNRVLPLFFHLDRREEDCWYSKTRLKEVLETTGDYANPWIVGALKELIDENISFEIIKSVEEQGEIETFDFAMENTHSFIAEGIINHNTTFCYHAIAEAQKMFPDDWCGFVDSEHTFDPEYAGNIGVNVAELMTAQPDSGTDAFAMVQGMIEAGAKLIVVDSVAAMVPREEMEEEDYGKSSIGLQARMMSKGLRKLASIAGKYKCVIIFTNQTRNKIGVMYGNPECVTPDTCIKVKFDENKYFEDNISVEKVFNVLGYDYNEMVKNEFYDVSKHKIKVKSFNHITNKNEFKNILKIVRKDDTFVYNLVNNSKVVLKCSGAHRIWDEDKKEYVHVQDVEKVSALNTEGLKIILDVVKTEEVSPIVDMEVEGNSNYFTNDILSHNTTTGGKALEYYASIRLRIAQAGKIEETIDGEKVVKAIESKITTVKNKCYAPYKSCMNVIEFGKGIDNDAGILDLAISCGLIVKKGGWYSIDGKNVAQGMVNLKSYLEENAELYEEIKNKAKEYSNNELKKSEVINESIDADGMTDEEIANNVSSDEVEDGEV